MKGNMRAIAMSVLVLPFVCDRAQAQTRPVRGDLSAVSKRVHEMSEAELGRYIVWLHQAKPTPAERVAEAAMNSVGQAYRDNAAMFSHAESDCTTFVEHVLAMALADSRESYIRLVARLRYANGEIPFQRDAFSIVDHRLMPNNRADELQSLRNRNLFTLAQWVPANQWCLEDVTKTLGAAAIKPWIPFRHTARVKPYLAKQGLQVDSPDIRVTDAFIPREAIPAIAPDLRSGDVVLIIVGRWDRRDCDHMGIIVANSATGGSGPTASPFIIHAAPPKVHMERLSEFLNRFPLVQGFKFLRLRGDAEEAAVREDAVMATRMNVPPAD